MGRDKASIVLEDGRPMIMRSITALTDGAGISDAVMVGGDAALAATLGIGFVDDHHPPIGPVGGILAALDAAIARGHQGVVALPCDLPALTPEALRAWWGLVSVRPDPVVIATVEGRRQYPVGLWRIDSADPLRIAITGGARSFDAALAGWEVGEVAASTAFTDADTPGDLAAVRYPEALQHAGAERGPMAIAEIDVDELASRLETGATLLDVRNPDEFEEARVPGAFLIPLGELPDRVGELTEATPLLIICKSGARSLRACEFLAQSGFDTTNIAGGTLAWIDSGREVVTGTSGA